MNTIEIQDWKKLASVQIGGAICFPVILIGFEMARLYGHLNAIFAIAAGNLVLSILSTIAVYMSLEKRFTTPENAVKCFGPPGKALIGALLLVSMCGWFAIQTQVVATELAVKSESLLSLPPQSLTSLAAPALALLFGISIMFGLQGITKLADIAIPLMVLTLAIALVAQYCSSNCPEVCETNKPLPFSWNSFLACLSFVLAAPIGIIVDAPTFFRHAKSHKDGVIAMAVLTLIAIPVIEIAGVYLYTWSHSEKLADALQIPSIALWDTWILLFMVFAAWTTNTCNLYSAAMGLKALLPKLSPQKVFAMTALIAIGITSFDFIHRLESVLDLMGSALASMGGTILTAYVLRLTITQKSAPTPLQTSLAALIGFCIGLTTGWLTPLITGAAVLDALIGSIASLIIFQLFANKRTPCAA